MRSRYLNSDTNHYTDNIMSTIASQITSLMIVYSTVYSHTDQRKYQSSASLAFVRGIHRRPMHSPHKWPVNRKKFPFDDVIMIQSQIRHIPSANLQPHENWRSSPCAVKLPWLLRAELKLPPGTLLASIHGLRIRKSCTIDMKHDRSHCSFMHRLHTQEIQLWQWLLYVISLLHPNVFFCTYR